MRKIRGCFAIMSKNSVAFQKNVEKTHRGQFKL